MLPHLTQQMAALGKASRKGQLPLTKYRSSSCTACLHISRAQSTAAFQPWIFHCRVIQSHSSQQFAAAEVNFPDIANHCSLGRRQQCHLQQSCPLSPLRCQNLLLAWGSTLCCLSFTSTKKTDDDNATLQVGKEPQKNRASAVLSLHHLLSSWKCSGTLCHLRIANTIKNATEGRTKSSMQKTCKCYTTASAFLPRNGGVCASNGCIAVPAGIGWIWSSHAFQWMAAHHLCAFWSAMPNLLHPHTPSQCTNYCFSQMCP